jgi:UDP-N-acetyl-D-galactosamine dehydrogenase
MTKQRIHVQGARVLVMGLTFKENCPDLRNTKVVDIVRELADYEVTAEVYDPWVSSSDAQHEYGFATIKKPEPGAYDAIILAVAHQQFKAMGVDALRALGKPEHVLFDLKYILSAEESDIRL